MHIHSRSGSVLGVARAVLLAVLLAAAFGCAQVKPWERELLAREDMAWEPDPLEAELRAHTAFSKEGALVGGGAGGGGCGCN